MENQDREEIKKEIPAYFPYVHIQLWYDADEIIGFSGTNDHQLEMLFLIPNRICKGYGRQIIDYLIQNFNITTVDVNEENENATNFYKRNGFRVIKKSELDSAGRPYPILHLELE
ncbi:GNAT family N-acetyltransferase [Virgibacillus sp. 179-BFC.A HS]|uniref:GNAT family N-acetyltransferase n=1 Tax=Tigheibacillus jepli TaxID=3035914 RepID=A0ABU5CEY8_9BACI|nr:GNAT family N-acetyltransferase [Virgibacillus sp. 179-BFC.A HS]MDY0404780.1 GNAT family N-acetyltransferase [Virgibacillus sp. 179-BFC.A HS]